MAAWCVSTGQSPDTWRSLTRLERDVFMEARRRQLAGKSSNGEE